MIPHFDSYFFPIGLVDSTTTHQTGDTNLRISFRVSVSFGTTQRWTQCSRNGEEPYLGSALRYRKGDAKDVGNRYCWTPQQDLLLGCMAKVFTPPPFLARMLRNHMINEPRKKGPLVGWVICLYMPICVSWALFKMHLIRYTVCIYSYM